MPADRKVLPRSDGDREALRILLGARREMTTTKTQQINRLRALLLTGDDADRQLSRGSMTDAQLQLIARRRGRLNNSEQQIRRSETRRLALAIRQATGELAANKKQLTALVQSFAPGLLDRLGVGPVSAAQAIVSFSHVGRCRNDAAFAALAGASPLPGQQRPDRPAPTQPRRRPAAQPGVARHRQNPLAGLPTHPRLHRQRRRAEGKSDPEIRRCIKRYVARELFRALTAAGA